MGGSAHSGAEGSDQLCGGGAGADQAAVADAGQVGFDGSDSGCCRVGAGIPCFCAVSAAAFMAAPSSVLESGENGGVGPRTASLPKLL